MKWQQWTEFANNPDNWQHPDEKGLLKAEYVQDYILRLWFEEILDISIYELDFYPLLIAENPGEVFLPLQDLEHFKQAKGDYTLTWPSSSMDSCDPDRATIDLAPECVRYFCQQYGTLIKAPHLSPSLAQGVKYAR